MDEIAINKIYNEDCLKTMGRMNDCFVDLVVTSPPYDDLRKYHGYSFDFENISTEIFRVLKVGGVLIWVVADSTSKGSESGTSFRQALHFKNIGFNLYDTMIYHKKNFVPCNKRRYEQCFEYIFCFSKKIPKTFNPIMVPCLYPGQKKNRSLSKMNENSYSAKPKDVVTETKTEKIKENIFSYVVGHNDKTSHNAPFPELLAEDQIKTWSNEGDIVYDPFSGSGTTAKMSILNNRKYIGSEISEEYCSEANQRISKYSK